MHQAAQRSESVPRIRKRLRREEWISETMAFAMNPSVSAPTYT